MIGKKILLILPLLVVAFLSGAYARFLQDASVNFSSPYTLRAEVASNLPGQGEADSEAVKPIELLFVGDIMLSRGVEYYIQKAGNGDYRYPFEKIADELRAADLLVGNLENPISSRGKNQGSIYSFRANPKALDGLSFAGFDVLSLANNHMWDWGADALQDTVGFLRDWGIKGVGAGASYRDANDPVIIEVRGVRVAFFSFTNL
ncbi:MAG: CapA family protein, partial [Patescibacteria group bacterium]